jgi:2-C-methyl-D-erythritol 2,4-cyclodiphosphate synthase
VQTRTGIGYDVHRFEAGRPLVLGGVEIPAERGLAGHSDADALAHAITDALLGAVALGDIGQHFPPTDPRWKDCSSLEFLRRVRALLDEQRARIVNIDATVIVESPRLAPHVPAMRERLAAALGMEVSAVSVKATTHESIGALGRGEGIAALAVATVAVTPSS